MRLRDLLRDRGAGILALVTVAYFIRPLTTETFYFRDLYRFYYPKKLFLADALRAGLVPLWDPLLHGGQPFLSAPMNYAFHPSNVLFLLLPPLFAFNLVLVLHVFFCAVAAYWLARTCELDRAAALTTGIVYGFCGYTLSTTNLTPALLGLPWVPLAIGLTRRSLTQGRSIVPAAIAVAMPLVGAAAELTALLAATMIVWMLWDPMPVPRIRRMTAVALALAGGAALSLIVTLPVTRVIQNSKRDAGFRTAVLTRWSVAPERLPELIVPRFFGDTDTMEPGGYWGQRHESGNYPYIISICFGVAAMILAAAAALDDTRDSAVPRRALAFLAFAAVLLSLGRHLPGLEAVLQAVPGAATFRYPVKALMAAILPVAILAGIGVQRLQSSQRARSIAMTAGALVAALSLVVGLGLVRSEGLTASFVRLFSFEPLTSQQARLLSISFFQVAFAAAAITILAIAARRAPRAAWGAAAVVIADVLLAGHAVNDYAPRDFFDEPPLAAEVRKWLGPGRFHSEDRPPVVSAPDPDLMWLAHWQWTTLNAYNAAAFGIPVVYHEDYDGLAPGPIARLAEVMPHLPWEERVPLLRRAGVTVLLAVDGLELPGLQARMRFSTPSGPLALYSLDSPMPGRFVSRVLAAEDERAAASLVRRLPSLDQVVLLGAKSRPGCGTAPVRLVERSLNRATYEVDAPCDGFVVLAENHYPGWSATVDGRPVPHLRADYAFTAVEVPRGRHRIERRYFPPLLAAGAAGSALALVLLVVADRRFRR